MFITKNKQTNKKYWLTEKQSGELQKPNCGTTRDEQTIRQFSNLFFSNLQLKMLGFSDVLYDI